MNDLYDELAGLADTEKHVLLAAMTTLRIGGYADYAVYPNSDIALDAILKILNERKIPYKFFGKGSDLLCSDDDYHGVIIRLDRYFQNAYFHQNEMIAQAGCSLVQLSVKAMKNGLSGLEFASGIPGTIGGAIFMNAGAYKASISDIVDEVLVYKNREYTWMNKESCRFSYRSTVFHDHPDWIILAARFTLRPEDPNAISELMMNRRKRRIASQPLEYPSCGSVFRNPDGVNAWELIEGIGYRGKQIGDACVSEKHCNFIINKGKATAADYMQLVNEIQTKVKEKYAIELQTEMEKFNW